jgi:hypothetical protein
MLILKMLLPEIDFFHAEEKKTPAPVSSGHAVTRLPGGLLFRQG